MFGFGKKNEPVWEDGPTHGEVENYLTGYRLGNPVESDRPGKQYIDPNNEMFQRGLRDGTYVHQEKERFLVEHPEYRADVSSEEEAEEGHSESRGGLFGWFRW